MAAEGRCGAQTRKHTPCARQAGWGTDHLGTGACKQHDDPEADAHTMVMLAPRTPTVMGMPLDIDPHDAILECIRIAAGEVAYASERIAELEASKAVSAVRRTMVRKSDDGGTVQEARADPPALHIWIAVRREAMDRLAKYSFAALSAVGMRQQALPTESKDDLDELSARRDARIAGVPGTAD